MKPLSDLNDELLSAELRHARHLHEAPESVIQRAIDVFVPHTRTAASTPLLQRVLARLSFDSAGQVLLAHGVRGSAASSRQVLFSAEGRDIDLRIVPAEGSGTPDAGPWVVFGQLLGPDRSGRVELVCSGHKREMALDDMLEFRFDGVPSGSMHLALHLADRVIELPPLQVPQPLMP